MGRSLLSLRPMLADAKNRLRAMALQTKPKGGLPDVIIIGAQKAGTTSLFDALARHSGIVPARIKEVHFADRFWTRGADWYARCFPLGDGLRLEATPNYLFYPHAAKRIAQVAPHARLIAILRDPVKRAASQHQYETQRGKETRSFEDAIAAERAAGDEEWDKALGDPAYWPPTLLSQSYLKRGLYAQHLARWTAVFDPSQILVMEDRALYADTEETFAKISAHIGLSNPEDLTLQKLNVTKTTARAKADPELYSYFASDCAALQKDWGISPSWSSLCKDAA